MGSQMFVLRQSDTNTHPSENGGEGDLNADYIERTNKFLNNYKDTDMGKREKKLPIQTQQLVRWRTTRRLPFLSWVSATQTTTTDTSLPTSPPLGLLDLRATRPSRASSSS